MRNYLVRYCISIQIIESSVNTYHFENAYDRDIIVSAEDEQMACEKAIDMVKDLILEAIPEATFEDFEDGFISDEGDDKFLYDEFYVVD